MTTPTFSIVVATRNCDSTLERCLRSVRAQSYKNIELLIVDGASVDNSISIADSYIQSGDYFLSEPDDGIYSVWNKALDQARGEWICFLGGDDYFWDTEVLANYLKVLSSENVCKFVYGQVASVDAQGNVIRILGNAWEEASSRISTSLSVPHVAAMHHCSLFQSRKFNPAFHVAGDYEFLRQELLKNGATFIPKIVAGAQTGGISTSLGSAINATLELRRILHEQGGVPFAWYLQFAKTYTSVMLRSLLRL